MTDQDHKRSAPTNTAKRAEEDPLTELGMHALVGSDQAIHMQEATGQRELCSTDVLPTDGLSQALEDLSRFGIKSRGPVEGDPIFTYVELPAGWKKQPTDHSMWSDLVDDKGRTRARIFYKAAFYDRSAHIHLESRFSICKDYDRPDTELVYRVLDCGSVAFETDPVAIPETSRETTRDEWAHIDALNESARRQCADWLSERYPQWKDPAEHWD